MLIIVVFWSGSDNRTVFFAHFTSSILPALFLPSSSVSSYFILAVSTHECLGKHSCMSSPFLIAILNGIPSFSRNDMNEMVEVKY